jgi:hypothetical protein
MADQYVIEEYNADGFVDSHKVVNKCQLEDFIQLSIQDVLSDVDCFNTDLKAGDKGSSIRRPKFVVYEVGRTVWDFS